jgi:hypothetical protein
MYEIVGSSGSVVAAGNSSGSTPLYIVHMRSGSAPLCSCQRRLYIECGASTSVIR